MLRMGMTQRAAVMFGLVAAIWLFPWTQPRAQTPTAGDLEQQFEQAFKHMLLDPSNLDNSFRYAELGIKIGDYEAAISALERMLLYNPDLPRVRLELGVLYFRLGSYAIARAYLTRAVAGDNVPDDVRARVAVFLDEIDNRLSNHRFSGSVYGGLRYQNNANAGPERAAISLAGAPGGQSTLDPSSPKEWIGTPSFQLISVIFMIRRSIAARSWKPTSCSMYRNRSEERRVGKECRSRGSPSH